MGKKRKFNRFIKWIKSDLPEEKTSVLLLGVTKLSSPTSHRRQSTYLENDATEEIPPPLTPSFREKVPHYTIPTEEGHDLFLLGLNDDRFIIPKTASFTTENKENNLYLAPKSFSFSGKTKKRVSFTDSNDITELNSAREIALRNRKREQEAHSSRRRRSSSSVAVEDFGNVLDEISSELNIRPIRRRSEQEAPSTQEAHSSRRRRSSSSVAVEDFGNVLDEISSELNIQPIRRRSEGFKFKTTDKFHSENDLLDRSSHRIPQRKLSAPITPVNVDDVNVIIDEIIEELNIGPRFSRSRSSSRTLQSPVVLTFSNSSGEDTSRLNSLTSDSLAEPHTSSDSSNPLVTPSIVSSDSDGIVLKNLSVADEPTTTDGGGGAGGSSSATRMDRSVDSIGSCSLDVDLSTDFSESKETSESDVTSTNFWGIVSGVPNIFNLSWLFPTGP